MQNTNTIDSGLSRRSFIAGALGTAAVAAAVAATVAAPSVANADDLPEGTVIYQGYSAGFMGGLTVDIAINGTEIVDIWAVENTERFWTQPSTSAVTALRERVVAEQSLAVDSVTGATFSSRAFLNAAKNALENAGLDADDFSPEVTHERTAGEDVEVDVLVIGSGFAGEVAAFAAATNDMAYEQSGLSVMMVERDLFAGGSSAASGGGLVLINGSYANDRLDAQLSGERYADLIESLIDEGNESQINRDLLAAMGEVAGDTANKLFELGTPFSVARASITNLTGDFEGESYANVRAKEYTTCDRMATGIEATSHLVTACEEMGVDLRLGTDVVELVLDESGAVVGAKVQDYDTEYTVTAKKTILACGGFAHESDLFAEYCPEYEGSLIFCNGGNDGDGIKMAIDQCGATMRGYGAIAYPGTLTNGILGKTSQATHYAKGIWVNSNGDRFDDGRQYYGGPYGSARFAKRIAAQENYCCYNVFDSTASFADLFETALTTEENGGYKAETVEELAELMGLPFENLQASIDSAAAAVEAGVDEEFGVPVDLFGTMTTPPFYGVKMYSIVIGTEAGLNVNERCQVLNADEEPVENLYAAGECMMGNYFNDYYLVGGGSLANCLMSGRIAAEAAKADLEA